MSLCVSLCRAGIDDVETDVVEIEAKLDKVWTPNLSKTTQGFLDVSSANSLNTVKMELVEAVDIFHNLDQFLWY